MSASHERLPRPDKPSGASDQAFRHEVPGVCYAICTAEAGSFSVSRYDARPDSSSESSAFRALRTVRISPEAPLLLMSSRISASRTVNQRHFGARGFAMLGETIRRSRGDGRPAHPTHLASGPPRETSAHATPCPKTPYERRKTRTPRPGGQGVHSEPAGAPVSRAPISFTRPSAADRK